MFDRARLNKIEYGDDLMRPKFTQNVDAGDPIIGAYSSIEDRALSSPSPTANLAGI